MNGVGAGEKAMGQAAMGDGQNSNGVGMDLGNRVSIDRFLNKPYHNSHPHSFRNPNLEVGSFGFKSQRCQNQT